MIKALRLIKIVILAAKIPVSIKILQCILTALLTPLSIYFTQNLINSIELYANRAVDMWDVFIYMSLLLVSLFFVASNGFFDSIINISMKRSVNKKLTSIVVNKFKNLDYSCFEDKAVSDTINRMGNAPQEKILNVFLTTISTMTLTLTILGTAIIFVQVSIWFSLSFIVILVPILLLNFKTMDMVNAMFNSQSEKERRLEYLSGLLNEKGSLLELKIFVAVDYIMTKWRKLNKTVLDERVMTTISAYKYFGFGTILVILWAGVIVFSLIQSIYVSTVSIGAFVALIGSVGTILGFSDDLSKNFARLSQQYLEIEHYHKFLSLPEILETNNEITIVKPHIVFDNVCFTYPQTDKPILKGVNFEIYPNQRVALVGENGVGKSTIIKLLCKLYRPNSGEITINGVNLNDIPSSQLKQVYSVVFQDYANYSLSLRENIAFGDIRRLNDDSTILDAINKGLATDILNTLPKGLGTNLGKLEDDGVDLSGGQWQRVAISRACMSDSAFIILDEPTASLDPVAESEMYTAFSEVIKTKGCIMISHRLASAKLADNIIVIRDGVVAEQGNHSELMSAMGLYESMFTAQSAWYDIQRE